MADDGRGIYITEPTRPAGKGSESSTARSRYGKEIRVRDRRHSTPVRGVVFILIFFKLIYCWPCCVFIAAARLSLVPAGGAYSLIPVTLAPHCGGCSCCRAWALGRVGFSCWGTWAPEHVRLSCCGLWALEHRLSGCGAQLSCPVACGIFPNWGSNLCPLI